MVVYFYVNRMNRYFAHIIFLVTLHVSVFAQTNFQTIVPSGPVVIGESFQVQYVLDDTDDSEFFAPDFKGFRVVSGPNIYTGSAYGASGARKLKNIVYTLAATRTGVLIVPGASARLNSELHVSNQVLLRVFSRSEAARKLKQQQAEQLNDDVFLSPGEDAYAKIRKNLFMKVLVDKTSCFVGEPVTAVFKLYSRLDSKSDIVKNPGFYGFTVHDMINLDDRQSSVETVNGKDFDVHIVRKVQLYPLQAGHFEIDAMEVRNKVRFSKSAVNKQPEQEIIEGVVADDDDHDEPNTAVFDNSMSTSPIPITVRAVPQKNKPAIYDGATGNFKLATVLMKKELSKNEEGELVISITGNGNFTQLSPPALQWPAGIDVFEPEIKDSLDYMQVPMNGKREFHYRFVSSKPGMYMLPAIDFSFFNPDTNSYRQMHTASVNVFVNDLEHKVEKVNEERPGIARSYKPAWPWVAGGLAALCVAMFVFMKVKRRKPGNARQAGDVPSRPTVTSILQPAIVFAGADDKTFYTILRDCIWKFCSQRFALRGSQVNKQGLAAVMQKSGVDADSEASILQILAHCETGIFTEVKGMGRKNELLEETKRVLEKIDTQVRSW